MSPDETIVIDGYDVLAEARDLRLPPRELWGRSLDRSTAKLDPEGTRHPDAADVRRVHDTALMPSTLAPDSPVIDLAWPTSGHFVASPGGVYLDGTLGVAQKLVDDQHPLYRRTAAALVEAGLDFRREINTDDYVCFEQPVEGLHTPQELATLVNAATERALPGMGTCRTFFSNSGAEAGEAAIKLAQLHAYRRFVERHGHELLARVMTDLGIPRDAHWGGDDEPVYRDYPFFLIGCDGAFHGRTLGVLNLTRSKAVHHRGYGRLRWVAHVPFNGEVDDVEALFDDRPIGEILEAPGGLAAVVEAGRVPVDLAAAFVLEVFQGEGGYRLAEGAWLRGVAQACQRRGVLVGCDEVQSFGRTGKLYAVAHADVSPDIVWAAKAAVLGVTVARAEIVEACHGGWHSNTFGSGKLYDVCQAWNTWHLISEHRSETFGGRGYLENASIKGEYLRMRLAELSAEHPDVFPEFTGLGGMWGLSVALRDEVIETAWRHGLKLLGCGDPGEYASVRLLLLADVLTHEIDELVAALGRVFGEIEERHPDL